MIENDQIFCRVIKVGPNGITLNSSFQHRNSDGYRRELGLSILEVCSTVPDGVLVFFPSYTVMEQCLSLWRAKSQQDPIPMFDRIATHKVPVIEPRGKGEFSSVLLARWGLDACR